MKLLLKSSMANAAPKPAPGLTPKILELTNGLRKTPWKAAPLTARLAPTRAPNSARGKRIFRTIDVAISAELELITPSLFKITAKTVVASNGYLPNKSEKKIQIIGPAIKLIKNNAFFISSTCLHRKRFYYFACFFLI